MDSHTERKRRREERKARKKRIEKKEKEKKRKKEKRKKRKKREEKGRKRMSKGLCGADCAQCPDVARCGGCLETGGCPMGRPCWVSRYIRLGGPEAFAALKQELLRELGELGVPELQAVAELLPLGGRYVNLAYPMPNGQRVRLLDNHEVYWGAQVESGFGDGPARYVGVVAGPSFWLVGEYGEGGANPELILLKRR